jgi:histidinol-phosphate/aromatic aminotransferase/cobyric acid decarboxylase-like protein
LLNGYKATDLTKILLDKNNLFIKDLSTKKGFNGEYIRVAVKRPEENDKLVEAIEEVLV